MKPEERAIQTVRKFQDSAQRGEQCIWIAQAIRNRGDGE